MSLLAQRPLDALALEQQGKYQEQIWELRRQGQLQKADELENALEEHLRYSKVIKREAAGSGVTGAEIWTFSDGSRAVFKSSESAHEMSNFKSEILAYRLDRKLGLNRVPVTVERMEQGERGSLQFFIDNTFSGQADKLIKKKLIPGRYEPVRDPDIAFFNEFTATADRNRENMLIRRDNLQRVATDHGGMHWARKFRFDEATIRKIMPNEAVYQRLKAAPDSEWRALMKDLALHQQVENLIQWKTDFVEAVEKLRARGVRLR